MSFPEADWEVEPKDDFFGIVGRSAAMRDLVERVRQVAASDTTVLIQGETGTGKELVAEALHLAGNRARQPRIVVDCGSLPFNLIENELFGHERGAYTSAVAQAPGAFERANGGTLFLDEIGELPLEIQPKLLRAIETRQVRRIGNYRSNAVDVRIIAATNRDLLAEVRAGRFREDLYFRLAVVTLVVPPLRQRVDDLPLIAARLLQNMSVAPERLLTRKLLDDMMHYSWPGNVRELRNLLERAIALKKTVALEPVTLEPPGRPGADAPDLEVDLTVPFHSAKQRAIERFERAYVTAMLNQCRGNISEACRRAGVDRMTFYRMLERLGLQRR